MSYHTIIEKITEEFEHVSDISRATKMAQYMRNLFPFYGIPQPLRASIVKPLMKQLLAVSTRENYQEIAYELWNKPQREFQYVCIEYVEKVEKLWEETTTISFLESLIVSKSWWDTVDVIASHLVGKYLYRFYAQLHEVISTWNTHENLWLNRTAIIFQLSYRDTTDLTILTNVITTHSQSKEFFLQKAIGWALRQYAYTDPTFVRSFVENHQLAPLSKREALKNL